MDACRLNLRLILCKQRAFLLTIYIFDHVIHLFVIALSYFPLNSNFSNDYYANKNNYSEIKVRYKYLWWNRDTWRLPYVCHWWCRLGPEYLRPYIYNSLCWI
jgi:hypothetical protein